RLLRRRHAAYPRRRADRALRRPRRPVAELWGGARVRSGLGGAGCDLRPARARAGALFARPVAVGMPAAQCGRYWGGPQQGADVAAPHRSAAEPLTPAAVVWPATPGHC